MNRITFTLILIALLSNKMEAQEPKKFNTGFCIDVSGFVFAPLYNAHSDPVYSPLLGVRRDGHGLQLEFNGLSDKKLSPFVRLRFGKRDGIDFDDLKKHIEAAFPDYYVDLTSKRQQRRGIMQFLVGVALKPIPRRIAVQPFLAGGIQIASYGDSNGAYLKARNTHELIEIHYLPQLGGNFIPFIEAGGKLLIALTPIIGIHVNASFINLINSNIKYNAQQTDWIKSTRQTNLLPTPNVYFGFAGSIGLHLKLFDY
ncbi:MAG: hypothetical protein WCR52_08070 [Bacteroidota bacterium]